MPGLFTSSPLQTCGPRAHMYEPAYRFPPVSFETSDQLTRDADHATRKRSRNESLDSNTFTFTYPSLNTDYWSHSLGNSRALARSPPPLANDRYNLAGGVEATDRFARQNGNLDDYFHLEKQRGMWSTPTSPQSGVPVQAQPEVTPGEAKPWMLNQFMNIVGGVAGKLYQFCSVPFRGFQAGGGQAYSFDNQEVAAKLGLQDPVPNTSTQQELSSRYPENNYGVLSIESIDSERPAAKRQRTAENWVVVDNTGGMNSVPSTPRITTRRATGHTKSLSQLPRLSATPAHKKRHSLILVSRRSTTDKRSVYGDTPECTSPLTAESQRLISKMRREEEEDDERMRRMSSHMSAMLREAREALGSKFEVEDEFVDDDDDTDNHFRSKRMPLFSR